jgi:hypothetical protein
MSNCGQTKGQSVLQHGESVKNYLFDLINHLREDKDLKYDWQLPQWLLENKDIFLNNLPDDETLELYTIFHDCGKPFCLKIDSDGKRHFPNHARVSYDIFKSVFNNDLAANLILQDMDIHLLKSDGVEEFSKNPNALTLLLTGLAEIHSNSDMFGGKDSTSFKIKWKSINQRGKQILNIVKNNLTHYKINI